MMTCELSRQIIVRGNDRYAGPILPCSASLLLRAGWVLPCILPEKLLLLVAEAVSAKSFHRANVNAVGYDGEET